MNKKNKKLTVTNKILKREKKTQKQKIKIIELFLSNFQPSKVFNR